MFEDEASEHSDEEDGYDEAEIGFDDE